MFAARLSALPETAAFAQAFCDRRRIDPALALRLTLVIEELFTNGVVHGHGGDSDATIGIALSVAAQGVRLRYADGAPRFDPRPWFRSAPRGLDAGADDRPVGGLGLHLVGRFTCDARYAYRGGNRIALTVASAPVDAPA